MENNVTFIGDFNADITREYAYPRSNLFLKMLKKSKFIPCIPISLTRFSSKK